MKVSLNKEWFLSACWVLIVAIIAHLAFSWIGYNPTDDGFILSYSRRLLEGQVPHLDFISIRPIGSAILHMPIVAFGGESTYWISRLVVWLQFSCIAWLWNLVLQKSFKISINKFDDLAIGLVIFGFSANTFPIMAWHSIDALFFTSIGVFICLNAGDRGKLLGYFVIGLTYLARQNFIFLIPLVLFILNDWKHIKYWLAAALPGSLYVLYLIVTHALVDAVIQISSQGGALYSTGILPYLSVNVFLGLVIGLMTRYLKDKPFFSRISSAVLLGCVFGLGFGLLVGVFQSMTFFLFGLTIGIVVHDIQLRCWMRVQIGLLSLATSWCISVSLGYNYPALAAGSLAGFIIYSAILNQNKLQNSSFKLYTRFILVSVICLFLAGRLLHIYREPSWVNETKDIGSVFPGANHIKVDVKTYNFLEDLQHAILQANGKYAILPDIAGYWTAAQQVNPLPIDWPISVELNNPNLMSRFTKDLEIQRGHVVIIVQKVLASEIAFKSIPIAYYDEIYPVVSYVKSHFTKIGDTAFFELYK